MLANILLIAFVSAYCAIVLLGHILLLLAIWPGLLPKRMMPAPDNADLDPSSPAAQANPPPRQVAA